MSMISITFIGFVIILVALYFLLPKKCQWAVLLAANTVFYLAGGWREIFFIMVTITSQYVLALLLERKNDEMAERLKPKALGGSQKKQIKREYAAQKKRYVVLSLVINLGILGFFKYANPVIESVNRILGTQAEPLDILTPIGLSYYTFKAIGYVIDVYRGRVKAQRNIFKLALYISYFPALVQGPIDRYEDLADQLTAEHTFSYQRLAFGAQRMLWGYIKTLVVSERAAIIVRTVYGSFATEGYGGFTIFFAVFMSMVRTYANFSGGMDIVMGLSEILGITPTENFQRPFFATSVGEYWRRWHITLGVWMRTYVFYPISLSPAFNKLGKKCRKVFGDRVGKLIAPSAASFITFFLLGMWHGVGWRYVLYGLYQATFVSAGTLLENVYAKGREIFKVNEASKGWLIFRAVRTYFVISMTMLIRRGSDATDLFGMLKAAFSNFNPWVFFDGSFYTLGLDRPNFNLLLFCIVVLFAVDYIQEKGVRIRESIAEQSIVFRWCVYYAGILVLVVLGLYGPGYEAASFVYERF